MANLFKSLKNLVMLSTEYLIIHEVMDEMLQYHFPHLMPKDHFEEIRSETLFCAKYFRENILDKIKEYGFESFYNIHVQSLSNEDIKIYTANYLTALKLKKLTERCWLWDEVAEIIKPYNLDLIIEDSE